MSRLSFWLNWENKINQDFDDVIAVIYQHWSILLSNWKNLEGWSNKLVAVRAFFGNECVQSSIVYAPFISVLHWLIDGSNLSALILLFIGLFVFSEADTAIWFALAWWLFVITSIGEEAGAAGDYKQAWGPYIDYTEDFGRAYGIKKGAMLGLAGGGLMAAASGWWWFMLAGATFPAVYFLGSSLYRLIHKKGSWTYAEPLYGVPFGLAASAYLMGL